MLSSLSRIGRRGFLNSRMGSLGGVTSSLQRRWLDVRPTEASLCAEVHGIDLSKDMSDQTFKDVHSAWLDNCVLLFRNQSLDDDQLISFSKRFGPLDIAPASEEHDKGADEMESAKHPEVWIISNVKEQGKNIGSLGDGEAVWHTDLSYVADPPQASLLFSLEVPPHKNGGHTSWLNMYEAFNSMPPELRERMEDKWANHTSSYTSAGDLRVGAEEVTDVSEAAGQFHPVILAHPETKKKVLYLGRRTNAYVRGMSVEDSDSLLDEVWEHVTQKKFVYEHKWQVGDLILWDNRCTMHRRDNFTGRRIMHRTQIKQTQPLY